jgi:hypothetical protein
VGMRGRGGLTDSRDASESKMPAKDGPECSISAADRAKAPRPAVLAEGKCTQFA